MNLNRCVKPSVPCAASRIFRLPIYASALSICAFVSVENPVKPGDTGVADLLATLRWIAEFPTAQEAYRARLLQLASTPNSELGLSQLGLVRIAYEGNCTLRAEQLDGNSIRITAEVPF